MINISNEEKHMCCGCNACMQICPKNCIEMRTDEEGFKYPEVDHDKCIKCNLCEKVCPIISEDLLVAKEEQAMPITLGGWHKDESIRAKSSSGGAFTLLAEYILNNNGIVFGAAFKGEMELSHIKVEDIQDLDKLRGSKYVQSDIGDTYLEVRKSLKEGRLVLFIGTPCQVAGLNSFLNKEYENLYKCDFVCHGVPSPLIFKKYIAYLEERYKDTIVDFNFRSKTRGWSKVSGSKIVFKNKQIKEFDFKFKDRYLIGFSQGIFHRPICYRCSFKSIPKTYSDITLGDFWGAESSYPELHGKQGTSLVLINSRKGEMLFNKVEHDFHYIICDFDKATANNPMLVNSFEEPSNRKQFFDSLNKIPFKQLSFRYMTIISWIFQKITKSLRRK